jgi:hypothetical protein
MKMARINRHRRYFSGCRVGPTRPACRSWKISGDIPHPHTCGEQEWKQLKHTPVTATNAHEKKTAAYNSHHR